ncbi:MAG: CopD family protein [Ilumatobacteraceae bacterium]
MFAAFRETGYNVMLFLHLLSVLVAFAPAFVHPLLANQTKSLDPGSRGQVLTMLVGNGRRIYAPALIVAGLFGFAMQGMSDGVIEFGQTWFWLSVVLWLAMNGVLHGLMLPAERAVAAGDESASSKVDLAGAIITLLMLVTLYLMVFKPGF